MTRTKISYSDAHSRVRHVTLDDDPKGQPADNSGWYVGGGVVAFQRTNARGSVVTTMIPVERILRIETTETVGVASRRLVDLIAITERQRP